jgi:CBS-domain-containing membrane protein
VGDIMKRKVLTIEPQEPVHKAFELMTRKDIRQLPVTSDGRIIGLITRNDLMRIQPAMIATMYERLYVVGNELSSIHKGYCESCGVYSGNLKPDEGMNICLECRKQMHNTNI